MARLTILAVLFATMIAVTNSQGTEQSACAQEISQHSMNQCRWYLGSLAATAQTGQCCSELTPISEPCRCEALRSNYVQASQMYTGSDELVQRMRELAEYFPAVCGWQTPTSCNFTN